MAGKQPSKQFGFTREMLPVGEAVPALVDAHRRKAWEAYQNLPYPTTREEAWRRTSLRSLEVDTLRLAGDGQSAGAPSSTPEQYLTPLTEGRAGGRAFLSGQKVAVDLAPSLAEKGIVFTDLLTAAEKHPALLKKIYGQILDPEEGKFAALTGAFAPNGIFVYVPRGVDVDQTLHSMFLSPGGGLAHFSQLFIYLEEGASLTYIHETSSTVGRNGISVQNDFLPSDLPNRPNVGRNGISTEQNLSGENFEIYVGQGANLKFIELQTLGRNVWSFGHKKAQVGRDAKLDWVVGAVGAHLSKHFLSLDLLDQGAEGLVSGMFFANGKQHLSYNTRQNHLAPNTYSNLLFKGALSETGRSVWRGMVYVAPGARHTDGYQTNRNLILSEGARATSIPGLEILNDEVRCSHGATVGKVDPEQMFYLQARGIPHAEAERLIVQGFFDEVLDNIPLASVRERLTNAVLRKLT
ncbi:MAG: hypothetical protein MAG431_01069 [Chloroflexi bacterium]|nr:hypothetical protein [Chloroflexota bacterium]